MQAAIIRHTEIDDIHTRSCTTPSSVTVPTALALARERGMFDAERGGERDLGRHRIDDAARRRDQRRDRALPRRLADLFRGAARGRRHRRAHLAHERGRDRARALARSDAERRAVRTLPGKDPRPLGDPLVRRHGGSQGRGRGARRRRRRSRPARRAMAARRAGPRRRARRHDGGARQPQRLFGADAQAVLLGQAGDRRDRSIDDPARRGPRARHDRKGDACACRRPMRA